MGCGDPDRDKREHVKLLLRKLTMVLEEEGRISKIYPQSKDEIMEILKHPVNSQSLDDPGLVLIWKWSDPWGSNLRVQPLEGGGVRIYSIGPNKTDNEGEGDDIGCVVPTISGEPIKRSGGNG